MAHITLPDGLPGIRGLLVYSPETARPIAELTQTLMRGPGTLTLAEREMVAAVVSARNQCHYCRSAHAAIAAAHLGGAAEDYAVVDQVQQDAECAPISAKMKALLAIAAKVQQDGKLVTAADVERARTEGATDREIHDVVLIAAAFCMFNRYVDGLGTWQPDDPTFYREAGRLTAERGYATREPYQPLQR
jgi:uncharacterized peroxidase-related enzyme